MNNLSSVKVLVIVLAAVMCLTSVASYADASVIHHYGKVRCNGGTAHIGDTINFYKVTHGEYAWSIDDHHKIRGHYCARGLDIGPIFCGSGDMDPIQDSCICSNPTNDLAHKWVEGVAPSGSSSYTFTCSGSRKTLKSE